MASIRKEIHVATTAHHTWDALRDYGAVHTRVAPGFALGSTHHQASVEVLDAVEGSSGCRLAWTTDVLPDDLAPPIDGMMELGTAAIARAMAE